MLAGGFPPWLARSARRQLSRRNGFHYGPADFQPRTQMTSTSADQPFALLPVRGLSAVLDLVTASHARAVAALFAVCLVSYLPGFFNIPPVDRDEARFVQATKQMLETGDFVDIRFQDDVRYKKPVGIYWLQAAMVGGAGALGASAPYTSIWLYRLPSLIGAVGAVLLTYWTALAFGSRRMAYLAALMLACSLLLTVEAHLAKTDAMLLCTVVAAMGALARAYMRPGMHDIAANLLAALGIRENDVRSLAVADAAHAAGVRRSSLAGAGGGAPRFRFVLPAVFWTALAGGILLKGPMILMVVGLTVLVLIGIERSGRWLGRLWPVVGVIWMLLLVLPWFIAIVARTGTSFFIQSFGQDLLSKVASAQETHGAPPGVYLLLFWITFWPGAPLAALAAPAVYRDRRDQATRFLLAWLLPSWIVFEIVITKLPHYVLPLYPAAAILTARVLERGALSKDRRLVRVTALWPFVVAGVLLVCVVGVMILRRQLALLAWPFAAAAIIFGFLAWRFYETDGPERSLLRAVVAGQLTTIAAIGVMIPLMRPLFPGALLAYTIGAGCAQPQFAAAGYLEPSLVFLFGTSTRLTTGAGAADFLSRGGCRYAFIEQRQERAFVQRAEAIGLRYAPGPRVEGINYSAGQSVAIAVYHSESGS
jgi:4-amino-4-deoxy-L-arabinose transferase-like glycosyltransferase